MLLDNPSPRTTYMREWRARNPEHNATYQRDWKRARRELVINHYGGKCVCCGETTYEFLAINHKNGGGTQHRAEVGRGNGMIDFIIDNNFPDDFDIQCHNCNQAIGFYGSCPHQKREE